MHTESLSTHDRVQPDPVLDGVLRHAIGLGLVLVALFPFARGELPWLGWAPMWLIGMPLVAWLALHRFQLPLQRKRTRAERRRPRTQVQARRRRVVTMRRVRAA